MVSASAITPIEAASPAKLRRTTSWLALLGVSLLLPLALGLFLAELIVPAIILAALAAAGFLVQMFHETSARRLVPVGMAGDFSVRLTGTSLIVGRLPCCNVAIPLPTVSAHHCRLYRVKSHWHIEDLDSRNGTFVNQKRIRRKRLRVGDRVSIGEFEFRVE